MKNIAARLVALAGAATLLVSAPAAAAARTQSVSYSPWAALSAFAAPASSQALCGAAGAAAATQSAAPGCVLPATDAPVPAPVSETAPLATPAAVVAGNGIGILPLLLGLAALGGVAALLLSNDNDGDVISVSP